MIYSVYDFVEMPPLGRFSYLYFLGVLIKSEQNVLIGHFLVGRRIVYSC